MSSTAEQVDAAVKSKRPSDSAFKQQRLPAWQPVLTAGTVLPTFFIIGILFIPVGVGLLYFSDEVREIIIDYTHCKQAGGVAEQCADKIENSRNASCICEIEFTLDRDFEGKVFMYYGLTNYYQNHRRYVKSRDDDQLLGKLSGAPSSDCHPFRYDANQKPIAPCGAIANSLFSDTLEIYAIEGTRHKAGKVPMLRTEIAWPSDKKIKFRNPDGDLETALKGFAKPRDWDKPLWMLDMENPDNNGFQNEDLIVWMRTAALPSFRKLYRRVNNTADTFENGLSAGKYRLRVDYRYPVTAFEGTKQMILSTTSILGGKNPFLGIAYIVVGCVCLMLGVVLLFIHIKCRKNPNDMMNVTPRTPYT